MDKNKTKYDSGVNILGSIPDYNVMLDYVSDTYGVTDGSAGAFQFRTEKSLKRFISAIEACILRFHNDTHRRMFFDAIADEDCSFSERLIILFWQLTDSNSLFSLVTREVFMKAVYSGRITIAADEVLAFLRYVKETNPGEMQWSDDTLKISASKYLTIMKKLGLAEGTTRKTIQHPVITQRLFVYFVRFVITVCPDSPTLDNPYMTFAFSDRQTIISRLKKIENIPYWDITQIGNDIKIDIKKQS